MAGRFVLGPVPKGEYDAGDLSRIFGSRAKIPADIAKYKPGRAYGFAARVGWVRLNRIALVGGTRSVWDYVPQDAVDMLHSDGVGLPKKTWCLQQIDGGEPTIEIVERR